MPALAVDPSPVPTLQGVVGAKVFGPRRMARTDEGQVVVIDARGRLQLLTKRGDLVGTLLEGAKAVAAGGGRIFAVNEKVEMVVLDGRYGKELGRVSLGLGVAPTGMSWDAGRQLVWMVFTSGVVQARRPDGTVAVQFGQGTTGLLYGLTDVAVDAGAGLVWVARDHEYTGGMIFGLDPVSGERRRTLGVTGKGPVRITGAIVVGPEGRLFVSDMYSNRVEVVGADDTRVQTIGVDASGAGRMSQPAGLAFMENGDLLVANLFVSRLERYGDGAPLPVCVGDTDCDGMGDEWEGKNGFDAGNPGDSLGDADADGLPNAQEYALGTDPRDADTDGDGETDGYEVANGTDPLSGGRPVVVAGAGSEWVPGIVRLSATVTEVKEPSECRGEWRQTAGPEVELRDADGFGPTFVARTAAEYRFEVVATCGKASSDPAETVATVVNVAPVAEATRVVVVDGAATVELSAAGSGDANADALGYRWEQVSGEAASAGGEARELAVTVSAPGSYRFRAAVADPVNPAATADSQVVVVGKQVVPVAVVASPVVGEVGKRVTLDASGSLVVGAAGYAWEQVSGPAVALEGAGKATASFVAGQAGRYGFEVVVTKAGIPSPAARAEVYVAAAGKALPVAVAAAPKVAQVRTEIQLDGTGSAGAGLTYAWRQVSGPATGVGSADRAVATAYLFEAGSYEFELVAANAGGTSVPSRVRVEAREGGKAIPVARVVAPASVKLGHEVELDGSGSTGATSWRWTQVGGPWVALEGESVVRFHATAAGRYEFELEVAEGQVRSAPARVGVVVSEGSK